MCRVIAVVNQKGGVGKTVTTVNLGVGLAANGKRVLLIDSDPQGSMTISLGYPEPDEMEDTLASVMAGMINEETFTPGYAVMHHREGVDFIPGNIELSGMEVSLVNMMSRETVLKNCVDELKCSYDFILIDCMPSLGMLTINALTAADSVLIPVQASYLSVKGLQQLLGTIARVKRQLNRRLKIEGILLTMVDMRTNLAKEISSKVRQVYGQKIPVFKTMIPASVQAAETSLEGKSIFSHAPKGKVACAYRNLAGEVTV